MGHHHPEIDETLDRLVQRLREAAASNLLGIALYGGLVKGRYTPGHSDINVLLVLADAGLESLLPLAPVLTAALHEAHVVPFVVTPADLRAAAVLFPVKILEMQLWHRLLWGNVHLGEIHVQPEPLRLRALQEIRNLELGLRLRVVEHGGDPEALWRGLTRKISKLAGILEILLRARGVEVPADRAGVLRESARHFEIPPERIERIAGFRRADGRPDDRTVRQIFGDFLELLAEICHRVEGEVG